ncbi:MAG: 2-dehydropantoate 2-reductase [Burkholderiaceae bacterium]|nr:2-dehydropantoate 2-reductase [Burkholderiaceae bacterium]
MRFLIVGAGALGGYFGARLLEAGKNVTFLLRPHRAAQLEGTGLIVRSRFGNLVLLKPPHVLAEDISTPFDVIIVGCKAYDLAQAMESFAPAVSADTVILPLLNGMRHLDDLTQRFGKKHVLGARCMISATLDSDGAILHMNDTHELSFGELNGSGSDRINSLKAAFSNVRFEANASANILQEMWEKWVFIAAAASITCLMRATVGDIVSVGAADMAEEILDECGIIASQNGFQPSDAATKRARSILTTVGSSMTASMFKDIERGSPIEADHIVGDLLGRASKKTRDASALIVAYTHLKAYEARREREATI